MAEVLIIGIILSHTCLEFTISVSQGMHACEEIVSSGPTVQGNIKFNPFKSQIPMSESDWECHFHKERLSATKIYHHFLILF